MGSLHVAQHGLGADHRPAHVDCIDAVPKFVGHVLEGGEVGDPGIVDQDGDGAEGVAQLLHGGKDLRAVRYVGTERKGLGAPIGDRLHRIGAAFGIEIEHTDGDPVGRQAAGAFRADPGGGSGDEGNLVAHGKPLLFVIRARS